MRRNEILLQGVEVIKSLGYKCFYPQYKSMVNEKPTYCYITDGVNIGYMQSNHFDSALDFSTVHKPHEKNGTGFGVASNVVLEEITNELVIRSFGNPSWAKIPTYGVGADKKRQIIKYASWEDYATNSLTAKLCEKFIEL